MERADAFGGLLPPYAPLSATANFTAYHTNSFQPGATGPLAQMAEKLVKKRIPVLISNHARR
jgi:DNA adenine methylase